MGDEADALYDEGVDYLVGLNDLSYEDDETPVNKVRSAHRNNRNNQQAGRPAAKKPVKWHSTLRREDY